MRLRPGSAPTACIWSGLLASTLALSAVVGSIVPAAAQEQPFQAREPEPPGSPPPDDPPWLAWNLSWARGLNYEIRRPIRFEEVRAVLGPEVALRGRIGAKLALDAAVFGVSGDVPGVEDGVEVRRARVYTAGELLLGLPISFRFELDLIQGAGSQRRVAVSVREAFLAYKDIPYLGTFSLGNLQTPIGLEGITSSRDITLMEPAAPIEAFAPGIKAGAQFARPVLGDRATWAVGLFANTLAADFGNLSDLASAMGRVTWLPVFQPEGSRPTLVHLGLSAGYAFAGGQSVRYRARPESHLAPFVVDTEDIPADRAGLIGAELAMVHGPWSLQSELSYSLVNPQAGRNLSFLGLYVSGSWVLTGESRPYDTATGVFTRLQPRREFSLRRGGLGAWEVGLRYSYLDLNDGSIRGGRTNIAMAGLNWYWSGNVKLRFNYGYAAIDSHLASGGLHIAQTRVELDF